MKSVPETKPNCRYCMYSGDVVNFICDCSILGIRRATGIRCCKHFVSNVMKYNQYAAEQQEKKECHNS